jgi:FemAB-related protein (PEP-CTERM system-associated)
MAPQPDSTERAAFETGPVAVTTASDADSSAWDAFVDRQPSAAGYHEWRWRRVFDRAFGHQSVYLTARRHDRVGRRRNRIVGVLPLVQIKSLLFGRTLTSLPFLNYGGVVSDDAGADQALLDAAAGIARQRRCRHVELRHIARRFPGLPCKEHKVTMQLRLAPDIWNSLDRKVRNQVRKAEKCELTTDHGGAELLADFYTVFSRNMRDLGTPVYSRRFFLEVLDAFPVRTRLHVVRLHGAPIAAGLTYRTRSTVEVPWASSIRDFNTLCPNHLLYWGIIERALEEGCDVLDFGRSTPGEGTYTFKAQWGARAVPLHWEYQLMSDGALPDTSPKNPKFHLAIELWKRLPLAVASIVGPRIVRAIP